MSGVLHSELVCAGRRWLKRQGCSVILHEPFRAGIPEQPDVIGWREGASMLLEAKASRADFLADAKKPWRIDPSRGVGDWRFYIAPVGLIAAAELPNRWGLLEVDGAKVLPAHGVPVGNCSWWSWPFPEADKRAEITLLRSALAQPQFIPRPNVRLRAGIDIESWRNHAAATGEKA